MVKKVSASFSEEKEAKKLLEAGLWALAVQCPWPNISKVFCAAFFQKSGYLL
jgi:hypothetical protein